MSGKIKYVMLVAGIFGLLFFSCKKEQQPVVYTGHDYFPNNVGHYVIYQCDSIIVNPFSKKTPPFDTFQYQIKEVIDSLFLNNQGQLTQRIVRYKRADTSTLPWSNILTPEKVWTGTLLSNMAVRLEDNINYIKLVFPMSLNQQWNGNAMNTIGTWNYQYTTLNIPAIVNGISFDSTLTVLQQKDSSLDGYQYYVEQYAAGVGLIYRKIVDWQSTNLYFASPPPLDSANSGTILYTEAYLSSGNQ